MYTLGLGSFLGDFADRYTPEEVQYGTSEEVNRRQKTENLLVSTPIDMAVGHVTSKIPVKKIIPTKSKNPVTQMTAAESRAAIQEAIILEEGADGVFRVPENVTKPSKSVSRRLPHNTTSGTTEVTVHTRNVERIAQTAGNVAKNLKTPAIEYKAPYKPSITEKITTNIEITGSKGKNVEIIKKIDGNTTITIEKHTSDIPPAYIIDDIAKGGMGRTSGNKSYLENYGGGKASNKVPPFANTENIHRNTIPKTMTTRFKIIAVQMVEKIIQLKAIMIYIIMEEKSILKVSLTN